MEQYPLVVVKCNRIEEGERLILEEGCQDQAAIGQDGLEAVVVGKERKTGETAEEVVVWYAGLEDILLTVLAVSDTYGLVWLLIATILVLTFLLGYLLHSCCRSIIKSNRLDLPRVVAGASGSNPQYYLIL